MTLSAQSISIGNKWINDMNNIVNMQGPAAYMVDLTRAFRDYRVLKVRVKVTFFVQGSGSTPFTNPINGFIMAGQTAFSTLTSEDINEQRWAKTRPLTMQNAGGRPTSISMTIYPNRVIGKDGTYFGDLKYTGKTDDISPYHFSPTEQIWWTYGVNSVGSGGFTAGTIITQVEVYPTVLYFNRFDLTT